jgi:hypothetical protein
VRDGTISVRVRMGRGGRHGARRAATSRSESPVRVWS